MTNTNDYISLSKYDDEWPSMARNEINYLKKIIPHLIVDIEHIGSTSIPNLDAKPIIDIMVGVTSLDDARSTIEPMEQIGYSYWKDNPFTEHFFFVKGLPSIGGNGRSHHVHVIERDSDFWIMQILFRDYLRNHHNEAENYLKLKIDLAKKFKNDRDSYTSGKTEFVHSILRKAGYKFKEDQ